MEIFDLTHIMSSDMPVYPGTEQPSFDVDYTIENDGFMEKKITIYSHTGTHIDAPAHLITGFNTLDQFEINHFYGDALLLDFENSKKKEIELEDLKPHSKMIKEMDFLLINTGWGKFWGNEKYYSGYKVLTTSAAKWLGECNLKGVGLDAMSVDNADSQDFPIHKILLNNSMIIIENLNNLSNIPVDCFKFSCFPLSMEGADGSPVRAVAYME